MNSAQLLEKVLQKTELPVHYYQYDGTQKTYVVYNEVLDQAVNFADNQAQNRIAWWQVHIFAPKRTDFRAHKKKALELLKEAGFRTGDVVTLYEKETQTIHVVIPCHIEEKEDKENV